MAGARPLLLVTVPHAFCEPGADDNAHPCDSVALTAARALVARLRRMLRTRADVVLLAADRPRAECDLNRVQCRDSAWRRALFAFARENRARLALVLDVHSFPPDYDGYGTAPVPDAVLLDDDVLHWPHALRRRSAHQYARETLDLHAHLQHDGARVNTLEGLDNDIAVQMRRELRVPAVLLELNEAAPVAPLLDSVARWVASRLTFASETHL